MIASPAELVDLIRRLQLLEPEQIQQIIALQAGCPTAKALASALLKRDWITAYQANQLLQGRVKELVLGGFVLLEKLGEGGMGIVFKARHRSLGRTVAVKVIRSQRLESPNAVRRFQREIRAAAQLTHPNIVLAYDADEVEGTHFLVMEYVHNGIDLSRWVKKHGPAPVAQACSYIRQAALGLQHAFERGMVHRDIKPHNLLLSHAPEPAPAGKGSSSSHDKPATEFGVIKLLDMGLARMGDSEDDDTSTLTQEGVVMGTVDYLAPEQAMDSHLADIRSDLYSLGCTFYFLLTGHAPFAGSDSLSKLLRHRTEEPPPIEQIRQDVPQAVIAVVSKLMAKWPQERFQTPAELAVTLGSLMSNPVAAGPGATPARKSPSSAPSAAPVAAFAPPSGKGSASDTSNSSGTVPPAPSNAFADLMAQPTPFRQPKPAAAPTKAPAAPTIPAELWTFNLSQRWRIGIAAAGAVLVLLLCLLLVLSGRKRPELPVDDPKPPSRGEAAPPTLTNSLGMKLVRIRAGKFRMGSPDNEERRAKDEGPTVEVMISRPFYMGAFETTVGQFRAFVKDTAYVTEAEADHSGSNNQIIGTVDPRAVWHRPGFPQSEEHPVTCVTWVDAQVFCQWLSRKEKQLYRLPTEAEWEYACRAGTTTPYSTGETFDPAQANVNRQNLTTTKVGAFKANAWALHDMHGNVWEWCADWYVADAYAKSSLENPRGPETGYNKVIRGGTFLDQPQWCRSAARHSIPASARHNHVGFRVALANDKSTSTAEELARQTRADELRELMAKRSQAAQSEWETLKTRGDDPKTPAAALHEELIDFRVKYPGTAAAGQASEMLATLPSHLDKLDGAQIPRDERVIGQPQELVAILGQHRWRHGSEVKLVGFVGDDQEAISIGADHYLRFWDVRTGQELEAHPWMSGPACISADGKTLAIVREDAVQLWDLKTRKIKARLRNLPPDAIAWIAFSPDGSMVAAVSGGVSLGAGKWRVTLLLWDVTAAKTKVSRTFPIGGGGYRTFGFSPDGKQIAIEYMLPPMSKETGKVVGNELVLQIMDLESGKERTVAKGKTYTWPTFVDGKNILGVIGATSYFVDIATGKEKSNVLSGGRPYLSPDRKTVAFSEGKIFDVVTKEEKNTCPSGVMAFSRKGDRLVIGGVDGQLRFWDVENNKEIEYPKPTPGPAKLIFTLDGRHAISWTDAKAVLLDVETWKEVRSFDATLKDVTTWSLTPDGEHWIIGGKDSMLRRLDLATGKVGVEYKGHAGPIRCVAVSADGKQLISVAEDDSLLRTFDVDTGKQLKTVNYQLGDVRALAISPDGQTAVAGIGDGSLHVLDLRRAQAVHRFVGHGATLDTVFFQGDGSRIFSHCATITYGWRLNPFMRFVENFAPHRAFVSLLPDGKSLATLGANSYSWGALDMWDVDRPQPYRYQTLPLIHMVSGWSFAPDGRHVALWNTNGTVSVVRLHKRPSRLAELPPTWTALESQLQDTKTDREAARAAVTAFRGKFPGSPQAQEAGRYLAKLPSPLDRVEPARIPDAARAWWTLAGKKAPDNFVSALGDPRRQPGGKISTADLSPDGKAVACVGEFGSCVVWSTENDELLAILNIEGDPATLCRLASDSLRLATAHKSGQVRLWDLKTRQAKVLPGKHEGEVVSLAYHPEGNYIASGGIDRFLYIWDARTEKIKLSLKQPQWVRVAFAPNGKTLATFGPGGEPDKAPTTGLIKLWDVPEFTPRKALPAHKLAIHNLIYSSDSKRFISHSPGEGVKLWDANSMTELGSAALEKEDIRALAFSPDNTQLITAGAGLRIWSLEASKDVKAFTDVSRLEGHEGLVLSLASASAKGILASGGSDGVLRLWDMTTRKEVRPPTSHVGAIAALAFSPDDRRLVSGGKDKSVRAWDPIKSVEIWQRLGHAAAVEGLAYSADGSELFCGSNVIVAHDADSGHQHRTFEHGFGTIPGVFVSTDSRHVLALPSGQLRVWQARTGSYERMILGHALAVQHLAVFPTGTLAATASGEEMIRVCDYTTGEILRKLESKASSLHRVAITGDGQRLVASSTAGSILVWELEKKDAASPQVFKVHEGSPVGLFLPIGTESIVSSDGKDVRILNLKTGVTQHEWSLPIPAVCMALSTGGHYLAVGNANGTIHLYRVPNQ